MKVELVKYPTAEDWMLCKRITLGTVGKDSNVPPTEEWKKKLLMARHSPIRTLNFYFHFIDLPYYVSVHLCRHVHSLPFVETQRTDRTGTDRTKKPQDAPVNMWYVVNAEELMTIANKRLCRLADKATQAAVLSMCLQVNAACPEFAPFLVPLCEYRGGNCPEMFSCGMYPEG